MGSVLPFFQCASASGGIHRASACCVIRGTSTSRDRRTCASGPVHRASACGVIRGTSTRRDHGTSTSGRVYRTSASSILRGATSSQKRLASCSCSTSNKDRVRRAGASFILRGASLLLVSCTLRQRQGWRTSRQRQPCPTEHPLQPSTRRQRQW